MVISINHRHSYGTHTTYDVFFFDDTIHTTVTHDHDATTEWLLNVECTILNRIQNPIVGLDVEWRPSFSCHSNPVATVQLCVGPRCLVYQIFQGQRDIPRALNTFFNNNGLEFVGVGVKADLERLVRDYGIGGNANAVELGKLAASVYGRRDLKSMSLKDLATFVLGKTMDKPHSVTMSRWDQRRLAEDQVKYACLDAFASFEIGRVLNEYDNH